MTEKQEKPFNLREVVEELRAFLEKQGRTVIVEKNIPPKKPH